MDNLQSEIGQTIRETVARLDVSAKLKKQANRRAVREAIDQFLAECQCGADEHIIRIRENGYRYTITREVDERKP